MTLIFYSIGREFWQEPFLNLVAAAAQMSSLTHVELAIGDEAGSLGQMSNVCRIFNDSTGVELTSRTGRNPQYHYLSLGCSKRAENVMLAYAKTLVGKPFSNVGMARSIVYPRTTDQTSFFCAELVACILQKGGLMSPSSNPGAATPESLHRLYKNQAAVTANPYTLRQFNAANAALGMKSLPKSLGFSAMLNGSSGPPPARYASRSDKESRPRKRSESPPRQAFRVVSGKGGYATDTALLSMKR